MGFSLNSIFNEFFEILSSDKKDSKKVKELMVMLSAAKKYAEECGQI